MKDGNIIAIRDLTISWFPKGEKPSFFGYLNFEKKGAKTLGENKEGERNKLNFAICDKCNIGISHL